MNREYDEHPFAFTPGQKIMIVIFLLVILIWKLFYYLARKIYALF